MSSDVLEHIIADTRAEVERRRSAMSVDELRHRVGDLPPPRGFAAALQRRLDADQVGLICEFKRRSPSKGDIRPGAEPADVVQAYERAGAACLSVLTDEPYFGGTLLDLRAALQASRCPALRKDFIVDPWQVLETRAAGADCMLIIMAALEDQQAADLAGLAVEVGLDVLVEVHDAAEAERAALLKPALFGINNRNLRTLTIDLATTEELAGMAPEGAILVCESGIGSAADIARMRRAGANCFLIGERLLVQPDIEAATRALLEPAEAA